MAEYDYLRHTDGKVQAIDQDDDGTTTIVDEVLNRDYWDGVFDQ